MLFKTHILVKKIVVKSLINVYNVNIGKLVTMLLFYIPSKSNYMNQFSKYVRLNTHISGEFEVRLYYIIKIEHNDIFFKNFFCA